MIAGAALAFAVPGPWQHHLALAAVQGLAVGGLALAPDIDHPRATFAWTAGPLSRGVSHLAAVAFGGHRQGLHSIPVTAALSGLALWTVGVAHCRPAAWAFGAFLAVLVAGGLIATGFARQGPVALLAGAGLAWYVVTRDPGALAWMIALGMGLHIAEDCCTGYGTALLWPFRRRRYLGARARVQRTTHGVSRARKARGGRPARGRSSPRPRVMAGNGSRPPRAPNGNGQVTPPPGAPPMPKTRVLPAGYGYLLRAHCNDCLDKRCDLCRDRGCECRGTHPKRAPKPPPYDPDPQGNNPPF